jgi:hypothetical protein
MWFFKTLRWAVPAAALILFVGCAKSTVGVNSGEDPDASRRYVSEVHDPPSYALFARSLDYVEKKHGIEFRRNSQGKYYPYSTYAWNHFSIADAENNCLFDVKYDRMTSFQGVGSGYSTVLDMQIERGPCGISEADLRVEALDRLQNLEGAIVSRKVLDNMRQSTNFISDRTYLMDSLQVPWELKSSIHGLEPFMAANLERIENPTNIAFGDIVVFSEYVGEHTVGIYVGYGVIVTNCCFRTQAHRLQADLEYRVYRLYSGFAQARYQIHRDSVLQQFLANP